MIFRIVVTLWIATLSLAGFAPAHAQVNANSVYKLCIEVSSKAFERSGEAADIVADAVITKCQPYLIAAVDELAGTVVEQNPALFKSSADKERVKADAVEAITHRARQDAVLKVIEIRTRKHVK